MGVNELITLLFECKICTFFITTKLFYKISPHRLVTTPKLLQIICRSGNLELKIYKWLYITRFNLHHAPCNNNHHSHLPPERGSCHLTFHVGAEQRRHKVHAIAQHHKCQHPLISHLYPSTNWGMTEALKLLAI